MKTRHFADQIPSNSNQPVAEAVTSPAAGKAFNRRSFLKNSVAAGAAVTAGAALLENVPSALTDVGHGHLTPGDAAILRWLAAAEIIESDLWLQCTEVAGVQDNEVSTIARQQIPGYPAQPNTHRNDYLSVGVKTNAWVCPWIVP